MISNGPNTAKPSTKPWIFLIVLLLILFIATITASQVQQDFGRIKVSNLTYENYNGIPVRAKLFRHISLTESNPAPGVVYIHGYQNNRETSDAYAIEMARRGFVVLEIDAIGRGNSGIPGDPDDSDFDPTYGGKASLRYLKSLPMVDKNKIGLMGHSLGAEMVYSIALQDPSVHAVVISGFAYRDDATTTNPRNMLMIFGKYDEFRQRMTATRDFEKEWMKTTRTRKVFPTANPEFGKTYGNFKYGSARRVVMLPITHLQTSHNTAAVAAALDWMKAALEPSDKYWIESDRQIWTLKEWATLIAMIACLASLLPMGLMLLRTSFFQPLQQAISGNYSCTGKAYLKPAIINGILMWLYFPIIFTLFGIHVYLVKITRYFR